MSRPAASMTPAWNLSSQSPASKPAANEAGNAFRADVPRRNEMSRTRSLTSNNKWERESPLEATDRLAWQQTEMKRESAARSKVPEYAPREMEQVRDLAQRDKPFQLSDSTRPTQYSHASRQAMQQRSPTHDGSYTYPSRPPKHTYYDAPSEPMPGYQRDVDDSSSQLPKYRERRRSDAAKSNTADLNTTSSSELRRRNEALSSELKTKTRSLEEKDTLIRALTADVSTLRRKHDEQSAVLASVRHELQSCQSQLDNVQRFVSTADTHADQDITQKLQELNEEVYKMSMTMADRVVECFTRQTKERIPVGEDVLAMVGHAMVRYLGTLGKDDDVALYLQIAFQAYLSHLLCHAISSWTIDRSLNTLIEETYQRLRRAETQAISGRWRNLTRTHILPSYAGNPSILVEYAVAGLSDLVIAAGLASSQFEAMTKFGSEFGEKILCVVSHAGKFGSMMSEMISGDFSVFAVQPGATFDKGSMEDMTEDDNRRSRGTRGSQTVLCAFRVGLKKQTGERAITLTKAQVVLKSFLG